MEDSEEITQQIRRSITTSYLKLAAAVVIIVLIAGVVFGKWDFLLVGIGVLAMGAFQGYVGQYIPLRDRHESLLNKYGEIYVEEVNKAIARYGIPKLTHTRWFDTYADEYCERNQSDKEDTSNE